MTEQAFSGRDTRYERPLSVAPRGRVVVPQHHTQNLRSVFGSTTVKTTPLSGGDNLISDVRRRSTVQDQAKLQNDPMSVPKIIQNDKPAPFATKTPDMPNMPTMSHSGSHSPVVNLDEILSSAANVIEPAAPQKPAREESAIKVSKKKEKALIDKAEKAVAAARKAELKRAEAKRKLIEANGKRAAKAKKLAERQRQKIAQNQAKIEKKQKLQAEKNAAKQLKLNAKKVEKRSTLSKPVASAAKPAQAAKPELTSRVLASAAQTMPINSLNGGNALSIDNAGSATMSSDQLIKFPKVVVSFDINKKRLMTAVKIIIVVSIVSLIGFLAWDIWKTNNVSGTFSNNSVGAVSIDDNNPMNVDPASISDQAWESYTTPADQPRYIYLGSINVRARVMSVGVNSDGNIGSPDNANDAGWYDGSAKPGQDGQVFINGHTSFSSSFKAAFDKLPDLKANDVITIELGDGDKITYKVVKVESVPTSAVNMKETLNVPDGAKQGLTLMTYAGQYDYKSKTTDKRVVVYAVREN